MTQIRVKALGLHFGRGDKPVKILDQIEFEVGEGEVFGLVGESGSGKSTVLRCIAGLYTHWTGTIEVNGKPITALTNMARARLMQMVFQDPYASLHPRRTVNSALAEVINIHRLGDTDQRIEAVLTSVGLTPRQRYRYPHQLSGGQRQRVAIARALILSPKILLLDEPTSALDVSVQAEILNLLSDLQERQNLTYVIVSHDLGVIAHMCDRLAVMQAGRIVEQLDTASLVSGHAESDYTRTLLRASRDYDRELAAQLSA